MTIVAPTFGIDGATNSVVLPGKTRAWAKFESLAPSFGAPSWFIEEYGNPTCHPEQGQGTSGCAVANLPVCDINTSGWSLLVYDGAAALAWGATVTGGASTPYTVSCNKTNWTVSGK